MRRITGAVLGVWLAGTALPAAHAEPVQVGVAAAVRGQVWRTVDGNAPQPVRSGEALRLGDQVTTDAEGQLQILLLDETVFTIGPNSAITIDEFIYDPATDAGSLSAEIAKGVFRFVSGRIAHKDPKQMKVKLPAGTIGVRGTVVSGVVNGMASTVALNGKGSITVDNAARQVHVSRPGFGTVIGGADAPPTPPTFVPPAQLAIMAQALGPTVAGFAGPVSGPGAPPAPGQPGAPGQAPSGPQGGAPGPLGPGPVGPAPLGPGPMPLGPMTLGPLSQFGPPPGPFPGGLLVPFDPAQQAGQQMIQIQSGIAKLEDLRLIQNGIGHFHKSLANGFTQTAPVNVTGQLEVFFDINFGARTVGGGNSRLKVDTGVGPLRIQETLNLPAQSFATGTGAAVFTATNGSLSGTFTLSNANNLVAHNLKAEATYNNGSGKTGSGTIAETPQISGALSPSP